MNELAFMHPCHFEDDNIYSYKLPEIVRKMNRVIMIMFKGVHPVDALRQLG